MTGVLFARRFLGIRISGYLLLGIKLAFFATRVGTAIVGRCR